MKTAAARSPARAAAEKIWKKILRWKKNCSPIGTANRYSLAVVKAWTGDKDGALADLAHLLRTPYGANVNGARFDPGFQPLHGDPRFEALLNNPTNNAPIFNEAVTVPLP